jgi:hypothetical protein
VVVAVGVVVVVVVVGAGVVVFDMGGHHAGRGRARHLATQLHPQPRDRPADSVGN